MPTPTNCLVESFYTETVLVIKTNKWATLSPKWSENYDSYEQALKEKGYTCP